jgi:FAD synthetase
MTKQVKTRILIFGTFDILHPGHLHFFKQARALAKNPYLIVSIARDTNVFKIKNKKPKFSEKFRLAKVKESGLVEKVVLGAQKNYMLHIKNQKPQIIALGHDQSTYTEHLSEKITKIGLKTKIFRLKPFKRYKYRSSLYLL